MTVLADTVRARPSLHILYIDRVRSASVEFCFPRRAADGKVRCCTTDLWDSRNVRRTRCEERVTGFCRERKSLDDERRSNTTHGLHPQLTRTPLLGHHGPSQAPDAPACYFRL